MRHLNDTGRQYPPPEGPAPLPPQDAFDPEALRLYQHALDAVSRALLDGDDAAYLDQMCAPYLIRTHGATTVVADAEGLVRMFRALSESLRGRGVTDYVRLARGARFVTPDRISGLHFTHILRNGERIAPPHAGAQVLVRGGDGRWRFAQASYAIWNDSFPVAFPLAGPRAGTPPPHRPCGA